MDQLFMNGIFGASYVCASFRTIVNSKLNVTESKMFAHAGQVYDITINLKEKN